MSQLKWNAEQYSVGISAMDDEHKTLIGLITALEQLKTEFTPEMLDRVFTTLEFYTKNHFAHEERIMARINYPKLEEHRRLHKLFINNLYKLNERFAKGEVDVAFVDKLAQFIQQWISDHILKEDRDYGRYLVE